jgi:hypothetical protein
VLCTSSSARLQSLLRSGSSFDRRTGETDLSDLAALPLPLSCFVGGKDGFLAFERRDPVEPELESESLESSDELELESDELLQWHRVQR